MNTRIQIRSGGFYKVCPAILFFLTALFHVFPGLCMEHMFRERGQDYDRNADAVNEVIRKEYTLNEDGSVDYHLFMRTRIITYRGKKQSGDMKIAYNSAWQTVEVNTALTRTLTPEGTAVPVREDEINDIQDPSTSRASLYSSARVRVINFPAVEPGVRVEADVTVHTRRPGMNAFWTREFFALSAPTTEKIVTVNVPESIPLNWKATGRMISMDVRRRGGVVTYTWKGTRLPKMVDEPVSPPPVHSSPLLLISTLGSYAQVAQFYNSVVPWREHGLSLDRLPEALRSAADQDDLYARFMSRFTPYAIDLMDTAMSPQEPEITLGRGYGTPLQLAWLFNSILRARGFESDMAVVSGNYMVSDIPLPFMPDFFPNFVLKSQDKWYSFHEKELPPGVTGLDNHAAVSLGTGKQLKVRDEFKKFEITTVDASYSSAGVTHGTLVSLNSGSSTAKTRRGFRYLSGPELAVARSMVLHAVDPLAGGTVRFNGLDSLFLPVVIRVDFTIPEAVPSVYGSSFFPVPSSPLLHSYVQLSEDRKNAVWVSEGSRDILAFVLKLPLGARLEALPEGFKGSAGPFSWCVSVQKSGRTIYYIREFETRRGILPAGSDYAEFLRAFTRLTGPDQGIVMFSESTHILR